MDELEDRVSSYTEGRAPRLWPSLDRIHFYPTPTTAEVVDLLYVPTPKTLSDGAAVPDEIPPQFHWMPEQYMLWKAAQYDNHQASGRGQQYQVEWERGLLRLKKYVSRRGGRKLPAAQVGRAPLRRVPHFNSQDFGG